jgi:hypothetical protein
METREILLKSDRVDVTFERIEGGKNRVTTSTWDDAKVILAKQVLEAPSSARRSGWSGSSSRLLTSTSITPASLRRVRVRKCNASQRDTV